MTFTISSSEGLREGLMRLQKLIDGEKTVIGVGQPVVELLGHSIPGLTVFPTLSEPGLNIPATQAGLWCWLRGDDPGELFHRSRSIETAVAPALKPGDCVDCFQYDDNRDLSGYEDGTENPEGDDAVAAAIVAGAGAGLDGSSFVAVQQWQHDFNAFDAMTTAEQDDCIGRHIADNEEFDEAPESAHVKRSAQESFNPEAFMLRHSMPWTSGNQGGLMFVAFGNSFLAFEAIMNRMAGKEDGIQDGLFTFTHPITGSYFWCPPMKDGNLDLAALGF